MQNVAQLRRLQQQFPDDLVVIGVHSAKFTGEKLTENIREAAVREGLTYPILNDADFKVWNAYNVHAWPTVVLIDPQGEIVGTESGEIEADEYIPVLDHMIKEQGAQTEGSNRGGIALQPAVLTEPRRVLHYPSKILIKEDHLFIADTSHHRIIELLLDKTEAAAQIKRIFGRGEPGLVDGEAEQSAFHFPRGLAIMEGTLYVADTENHAIRAIDLDRGDVRTVAGTGKKGMGRIQGDSPLEISMRSPWAVLGLTNGAGEGENVLFIAMAGSHQIWALISEEHLGIFAGNGREALVDGAPGDASFNQPSDLAFGMGHLVIADAEASAVRAISLTEEPKVFTLVGQGLFEFGDQDGIGPDVRLQHPTGLAFGEGVIYIADTYNHKVKALDPSNGDVRALIGTGTPGKADGDFEEATLYHPEGLALAGEKLYIADTNNHRIRIASLKDKKVETLELRGIEPFENMSSRSFGEIQPKKNITRLSSITVSPGSYSLTVNILFPEGYKVNEAARSRMILKAKDGTSERDRTLEIHPEGFVTWEDEAYENRELVLELVIYYCQIEDQQLCMIYDETLVLPVDLVSGAPDRARVDYELIQVK